MRVPPKPPIASGAAAPAVETESGGGARELPGPDRPLLPVVRPQNWTLSVEVLSDTLNRSSQVLVDSRSGPLPESPAALAAAYTRLGTAVAMAEACLLSSVDALDPRTGGGVAQPTGAFAELRRRAFAVLRSAGRELARMEPAFQRIVQGEGGWPSQPVEAATDRGDGRPLYLYRNTYKHPPGLSSEQILAEHQERVDRFIAGGGRWENIIEAEPATFRSLQSGVRYDYVLKRGGPLRLHENYKSSPDKPAKPGHSLLATGGPELDTKPVLLAGEIWVLKDSAGDVEAVVVANNSGHYKPAFEDLTNALSDLEQLGIPADKVILFGGLNNMPNVLAEIVEKTELEASAVRLPPTSDEVLASLANPARKRDAISIQSWSG